MTTTSELYVATANVGADSAIIASVFVPLTPTPLPVTASICQTDAVTGVCINPTIPATSPHYS